jgi:hypothetical protein
MTMDDRLFPSVPGQLLLMRIGNRLLRVSISCCVELLSSEAQNTEWTTFWSTQDAPELGRISPPIARQIADMVKSNYISKA